MSRSLLHDWEGSVEKNKNNTEELLKIAEDIYNTAYTRGKASTERPHGGWIIDGHHIRCNRCNEYICNTDREGNKIPNSFCPNCGAAMGGEKDE